MSDSRKFSALGNGLCSLEIGHWVLWSTEERVIRDKQIPEAKHRSLHSDRSLTALMGFLTDCYWKIKDKNRTIWELCLFSIIRRLSQVVFII